MATEKSKEDVLQKERLYYETHKEQLLATYENLFVLIKGEQLIGTFPDAESAYNEGISRFGLEPFLVKQVLKEEPVTVIFFSANPPHAHL